MKNSTLASLAVCVLAGLGAGCGQARSTVDKKGEGASAGACTPCHGGTTDDTGAPPRDLRGLTATTEISVGAHTAHVKAGALAAAVDCTACHRKPGTVTSPGHLDGATTITWGGISGARGASPSWDRATATCSNVYCHGATLSGGANVSPRWTVVDGSQVACGSCHGLPPANHPALVSGSTLATCNVCHPDTVKADGSVDAASGRHVNGVADGFTGHPAGWLDVRNLAFHGTPAASNPQACRPCHAVTPPASVSTVTCTKCHENAGAGDWTMGCTSCHGSAASSAPPRDLSGNTASTFLGVGAHQSHVLGTHRIAAPLDCTSCHEKPAAVSSSGHLDGTVQVTGYTGSDPDLAAAVFAPGWSRASASCSTSYCHGAGLGGGVVPSPTWTRVDGSQAFCGSCHGLPPTGHPALAAGSDVRTCGACHPDTVKDDGAIDVAAGKHLNGRGDGFAGHPADWMTKGSAGFHGRAVLAGVSACLGCHSATGPARVSTVTCASCHDALAGGDWTRSCSGCHGSATSDAPPRDLIGNTATTFVGVGAHQSHLQGTHGVAAPLDCTSCHPRPASALAAPHLDGRVDVTGYTGGDTSLLAAVTDPGWNRSIPSCATSYCHGATLGGGTASQPVWTRVDGSQVACGSCHALPPPGHRTLRPPVTPVTCAACHPSTVKADGAIDAAGGKHVNGTVETDGFTGHGAGWLVPGDPAFHGREAIASGMDTCFRCHSAKEPSTNGIRTCASCHDALAGGGDWTTSCVGCHGSDTSSAPPRDVHGNTATTAIGVGAHRAHVEATSDIAQKYDCSVCHEKPSVVFSPSHLDGATTVTGYTGTDPSLQFIGNPGWNRTTATCSTSWCHGGYSGTYTYSVDDGSGTLVQVNFAFAGRSNAPTWNRVDGAQAACGTCHAVPPSPSGYWHSGNHGGSYGACTYCHPGVDAEGAGFTDVSRHVDGTVDVTPRWETRCFNCH